MSTFGVRRQIDVRLIYIYLSIYIHITFIKVPNSPAAENMPDFTDVVSSINSCDKSLIKDISTNTQYLSVSKIFVDY